MATPSDSEHKLNFVPLQSAPNATALDVTSNSASISFHNVAFQYVPGKNILQELNFDIAPGKKVAIVGGSGSGLV